MKNATQFAGKNIVLYDGDCGVCNFWVQWILKRDTEDKFLFAALQSDFGQQFLIERNLERQQLKTLYMWKPGVAYFTKSRAVLEIAASLGGIFSTAKILTIIPAPFFDIFYHLISENRNKISRQKCFVPDAKQKAKFLN